MLCHRIRLAGEWMISFWFSSTSISVVWWSTIISSSSITSTSINSSVSPRGSQSICQPYTVLLVTHSFNNHPCFYLPPWIWSILMLHLYPFANLKLLEWVAVCVVLLLVQQVSFCHCCFPQRLWICCFSQNMGRWSFIAWPYNISAGDKPRSWWGCISMHHPGVGDYNLQCSPSAFFWLSLQSVQLSHCSVGNVWMICVSLCSNLPEINCTTMNQMVAL